MKYASTGNQRVGSCARAGTIWFGEGIGYLVRSKYAVYPLMTSAGINMQSKRNNIYKDSNHLMTLTGVHTVRKYEETFNLAAEIRHVGHQLRPTGPALGMDTAGADAMYHRIP